MFWCICHALAIVSVTSYDMAAHEKFLTFEYPDEAMKTWQALWGKDFISPGGADATRHILRNTDLAGKTVLEVGSGWGGPSLLMASELGAMKVIGIDLQEKVIPLTNDKAKERGLSDKVEFVHVQSLRWPFPDNTFDVVFSKDALLHTPDKETLYTEIKRVLKPGGVVRYADWFTTDLPATPEMAKWLDENKLTMVLKSLGATADIFIRLGFTNIELEDRAEHFGTIFHEDMTKLDTNVGDSMQKDFGKNTFEQLKEVWFAPCPILARQGQLRIGNLYATKPQIEENTPRSMDEL